MSDTLEEQEVMALYLLECHIQGVVSERGREQSAPGVGSKRCVICRKFKPIIKPTPFY